MNILFLTQILPYPPDAGPRVKTWHVLRYLAGQGHKITLVSFVRADEQKYVEEVRRQGIEFFPVPIRRSRIADVGYWLRSNLSGLPFLIERDNLPEMRKRIDTLLTERQFHAIHADQLTMTQFVPLERAGKNQHMVRVFDAHNATWSIMERMKDNARAILKPVLALEQQRIKKYEGRIVKAFEHTLTVTDIDRELLLDAVAVVDHAAKNAARERIVTVPITIDTMQLKPTTRQPGSLNILTLGTLHYMPNADGIRWFLNEIFPRVRRELPNATLTIIGKNPPADFLQAAQQEPDTIQVTGYVEDLTPYFERAALMVVPVRAGSGMRVRILEAFSRAMPVVTTTVGLEGIEARPGEDVLVADTPSDFAAQVVCLARDTQLQERLANNGRSLAVKKYDWQVALRLMNSLYQGAKR